MKQLTELDSWTILEKHAASLRHHTFTDFKKDKLHLNACAISINFNYQLYDQNTIELLIKLANDVQLKNKIHSLISGEIVNKSEQRPALHTALRIIDNSQVIVDGTDIMPDVLATREQMRLISTQIKSGKWLGYSNKPIKDIVNIGIGGSDFGPRFCIEALSKFTDPTLAYHFISDADPDSFDDVLTNLNPETTLFIVSSKSFTTQETHYNTQKAFSWFDKSTKNYKDKHFIAVTANADKAQQMGITHILPIWNWVGGRYSVCSAINLITCIAIGYEAFMTFLAGANQMDKHFYESEFHENMPVMLALTGLWNINFLHISTHLLLVYTKQLEKFVAYVQQLDMESNGKSIDNEGHFINYATGPIVWGGSGNQAQHSYYQLLCQGSHKVAGDFISLKQFDNEIINTMCKAKIKILSEGINPLDKPNGLITGGTPLNHISLESCTPTTLGSLIALYEHKVYVQGVLWNINSFDQPGVESAKAARLVSA